MSETADFITAIERHTGRQGRRNGKHVRLLCPAHDDHHPSLDVAEGDNGKPVVQCRSHHCTFEAICEAIGWERGGADRSRQIVATYDYVDEQGRLLFQAVRYQFKDFKQRRPDGAGGWIWKLGQTRRVLYRLPAVRKAVDAGETIYVVEGEKDVHTLEQAGVVATCNPMGAGKWRPGYADMLAGAKRVVMLPDDDDDGRAHVQDVARSLVGRAGEVKIVQLYDPPGETKRDVSDWLAETFDRELELAELVERTPAYTLEPGHPTEEDDAHASEVASESSETVWGEPVSFPADNIEAAVSFPSHVLPNVARNVVTAVSRFVQVDESLVAQDVLGIASFPIARKVVVVEGEWWEEGNLWTIAAAESGERKSAALRRVVRAVREVERERRETERGLIADEGASLELLEQQYTTAVKRATKAENEVERIASETEVRELARQVSEAKGGLTRETRLIVDDVTPEFFGRELADNNPLLFANAEGGLLDNFINRYTNIPNLDLLNASYSGDDYSPGRATRNAKPVERPLSCFALSPQPIVVAALTTNEILVHRGTLSRFLYWFVPRRAGTRAVETQPLDLAAVEAWSQRIRELLSLPDPGADPYQVRMSDDAVAIMLRYRQRVEDALRSAEGPGMRAWLNRARGHAQRLALVLHFLAHGVDGISKEITAEHAGAAVELMTAYQDHAMIAFDLMNEAPLLKRSRTMLGWLRERNAAGTELTVREAHRSHQRWGSVKECRDVLAELHGRGWIWMESREASSFLVHPDLHKLGDRDDR